MNPYDRTDPTRRDAWDEGHAAAQAEIAAAQADALALREALAKYKWAAAPEQHGGTSAYPYEEIGELLSRPTSQDALRAVLERAVGDGWAGGNDYAFPGEPAEGPFVLSAAPQAVREAIAAIVSRILGEDRT